jgi:hypothetical protein
MDKAPETLSLQTDRNRQVKALGQFSFQKSQLNSINEKEEGWP